ncbi:potassium-transporting ATPase subunit C [Dictyobacter kobayashii]|uniref:Potassium-transporting ATPase KdpC subunit n=1 Tax=Dictyobacter kobayashii TaxID=2014872 RepID=A0A402ABR9_9CHLR|nr:potassium-transporting ATPase subunit C [Dictyobacter kobayashii]GCE16533.1 potassium-transporting ATPase KdpC subunit [Dictyobacter kobayashii]
MKHIRPAIMITLLFVIVTCVFYPAVVTGLGQLIFPSQANGSLVYANGKPVGSILIGQYWTSTKYFHGRPSATANPSSGSSSPYEADNSAGSNLGPTNGSLLNGNGSQVVITKGTPVPANATPVAGKKNTYYVPGTYLGVNNYADQFRKDNGLSASTPLPSDIVTASGSGLDPDVSPEAALLQVNRVASVRGLDANRVKQLVNDNIQGRFLWVFGEPHVNVLDLNLALDQLK